MRIATVTKIEENGVITYEVVFGGVADGNCNLKQGLVVPGAKPTFECETLDCPGECRLIENELTPNEVWEYYCECEPPGGGGGDPTGE